MPKKVSKEKVAPELLSGQSTKLLQELHLLTRDGDLNADARRKLKQVNHFVNFLRPAVEDLLARHENPVWVDFGSGNSYLPFIAYEIFFKNLNRGEIHAVEKTAALVEQAEKRARKLGFSRMHFSQSTILESQIPERMHLVTALHACDTATDDVIVRMLQNKVDYVFLVPCCQAEIARLLEQSKNSSPTRSLYEANHHRREFGSHLTNVIRSLVLQSFGYQVRVTEVTSFENTHKGELLIGKRVQAFDREARTQLVELLEHFDIKPKLTQSLFSAEASRPPPSSSSIDARD